MSEKITNNQISEKRIKRRKEKDVKILILVMSFIAVMSFLLFLMMLLLPTRYDSELDMKREVQGVYTLYDRDGVAVQQIAIRDDIMIYFFRNSGRSYFLDSWIDWIPSEGKIKTFQTFEVLKDGSLRCGRKIFKKGGTMQNGAHTLYSRPFGYEDLVISDVTVVNDSGELTCRGLITNCGDITYKNVVIECLFSDPEGNEIGYDLTVAVGSQGIDPRESVDFEMKIQFDGDVHSCRARIVSYRE